MFISQYRLILIVSLFISLFFNYSFFQNVIEVYPFNENILHVSSLFIVLFSITVLFFTIFASKKTTKPMLITILIISSFTGYFMDSYHVVIDSEMIRNTIQTDVNEAGDLFSLKLVLYVLFLGLIPSYLIYKLNVVYRPLKKEIISKVVTFFSLLTVITLIILAFSRFYTSFFREHKTLRFYVNPIYWMYSIGKYTNQTLNSGPIVLKEIGQDAKIKPDIQNDDKKELIIMVVGEATRADRLSLNGYEKKTNPLLEKQDVVSLKNMYSCGTSTAYSVPCMFSIYDRDSYDYKKGISTKNVLDVLNNTKDISILWRDNNSDSKGVALRVDYEDFRTPDKNSVCIEGECRDIGMLKDLDKYVEKNKSKDILIVLHQIGNHGPAYYKRYPKEFEKFTPVCKTNQLEECTQEEISNAYDNAILYSDYFLSEVINFLKPYSKNYETAMLYMADHGESLGENGLYLHGLPYFMAPDNQKNVASFIWIGNKGETKDYDWNKVKELRNKELSQDNLFHTLLGLFEVETKDYDKNLDMLNDARLD